MESVIESTQGITAETVASIITISLSTPGTYVGFKVFAFNKLPVPLIIDQLMVVYSDAMATNKTVSPEHTVVGLFERSSEGNGVIFKVKIAESLGSGQAAVPETLPVISTCPFKISPGPGI